MAQLPLFVNKPPIFTVGDLTAEIKELFINSPVLQDVWVQGEISNLSLPKSGHMYFTIKDEKAALKCVMWRTQVARMMYTPQNGDLVEVHGGIGVYEPQGAYQLYADDVRPAGEGVLYQEFLRLKEKLEAEGLFDPVRKRPLPERPNVIGIVTSPTGAAIRDMLNTLRRRYPLVQVVIAPATVQGKAAPAEVADGIKRLNQAVQPDVIIIGRGGGSIEDLWAFNDEDVARAVAASNAPIISGVGHETDFTIADFVADLRAPTPTAAAELAVPDKAELRMDLDERITDLAQVTGALIGERRWALKDMAFRLRQRSPLGRLQRDRQQVDDLLGRGERALSHYITLQRTRVRGGEQRLGALNPEGILARGYAVVSKADGTVVRRMKDIEAGEAVEVRVVDGAFTAEVKEKE